jgi:hypothetical protein
MIPVASRIPVGQLYPFSEAGLPANSMRKPRIACVKLSPNFGMLIVSLSVTGLLQTSEAPRKVLSRAPIGLDMDRIMGLSNPYPFGKGLSNPYPIYPHYPWINWIG